MVWHVFVCTSVRTSYHFASLTTRRRVLSTEVCPGFGDQPVNAARAESLQIGRKVSRPMGRLEEVEAEKEAYRSWVEDRLKLFFPTSLCGVLVFWLPSHPTPSFPPSVRPSLPSLLPSVLLLHTQSSCAHTLLLISHIHSQLHLIVSLSSHHLTHTHTHTSSHLTYPLTTSSIRPSCHISHPQWPA